MGAALSNGVPDAVVTWKHIETLSPSAAASVSTGTLPVYERYLIMFRITINQAGESTMTMKINDDGAGNYYFTYWNNLTPASSAAAVNFLLCTSRSTRYTVGMFELSGKSPAVASGFVNCTGSTGTEGGNGQLINGEWNCGSAVQVSKLTFTPTASTLTGKIEIFGRNPL